MDFNSTIQLIASILNSTGTTINTDDYDGIIVKKLEASNTLDENRTTNQTHIAITGNQMDIFPYLRSAGYFNEKESDSVLKKYFITQVPITLYESNIRYLNSENNEAPAHRQRNSCLPSHRSLPNQPRPHIL